MKAMILCAGRGVRLRDLTKDEIPKCLVKVGGEPILKWQLEAMQSEGVGDTIIVTGFREDRIRDYLEGRTDIFFTYNPEFKTTNILTSFWMALNEHDIDDNVFILAGDVIFERGILSRMLSGDGHDIVVALDRKRSDPEAVKVTMDGSAVARFGKDIPVEESEGEFLGLMLVRERTVKEMRDLVNEMMMSEESRNAYLFDMLNNMITRLGKNVGCADINGYKWEEIDFKEDWLRANDVFSGGRIDAES